MIHKIGHNNQRNNFDFAGKFPGWSQCFSTSAWMFMSFYSDKIDATNDTELAKYVDDVEVMVGAPGVAETVKRKISWITGYTSLWWAVQQEGITKWLNERGVSGKAVFEDCNGSWENFNTVLDKGPVIYGTQNIGGISGGHIILITGKDNGNYVVNDPFGNATTMYTNYDGDSVRYTPQFLYQVSVCKKAPRIIYWKG